MATQPNITVQPDVWTSINSESGVAIGTAMQVMNLSLSSCILQEKSTQPAASDNNGQILTGINKPYALSNISDSSDEIWVKPTTNSVIDLAVNV